MYDARYESYGVNVKFIASDAELLEATVAEAKTALVGNLRPRRDGDDDLVFEVLKVAKRRYVLKRNGTFLADNHNAIGLLWYFEGMVRLSVAEFAPHLVFLHAGAVAWNGKGIILPADSFRGKSTLVRELVRMGAEYYSDDFAIIDSRAKLHPFPRPISMRHRDKMFTPYTLDPVTIGAQVGTIPVPIRLLILTRYRRYARFKPRALSAGEGILKTVPFVLPLNQNPEFALSVLNRVALNAIIATSDRGDARRAAGYLLELLDTIASK